MQASNVSVNEENCNASCASKDWQYWCRLCAKDDIHNSNIFSSTGKTDDDKKYTLLKEIRNHFCVQIKHDDGLPKLLCTECNSFLSTVLHFNERVAKVQEMYATLQSAEYSHDVDFHSIRMKYGILKEDPSHLCMQKYEGNCFNENVNANVSDLENFEIKLEKEFLSDCVQSDGIRFASEDDAAQAEDPFASDIDVDPGEGKNLLEDSIEVNSKFSNSLPQNEEYTDLRTNDGNRIIREEIQLSLNQNKRKQSEKRSCSKKSGKSDDGSKGAPSDNKYFCSHCSLYFQRPGSYHLHMKKRHGMALDPLTCPQCPKSFKSRSNLNLHIKTHRPLSEKRIFPCPQCDRKFQTKDYVAKHIKFVHEDIRSFICEECGEGLRTKATLEEHMLTHTDLAPFECEICKKGFKNRARLKRHLEIHSSTKHTCSECGLKLNSRVTLNRHMLVHSDTIRHKCDYCGRGFKRTKTLKTHLILHSGLKPYACNYCEKTFTDGSNRRTHMKRAHPSELAAAEASGEKTYTKNIPNLAVLKAVTQSSENLIPVVSKQSGNFSLGRKPKLPLDSTTGTKGSNSRTVANTSTATALTSCEKISKEKRSGSGNFSDMNDIPSPLW